MGWVEDQQLVQETEQEWEDYAKDESPEPESDFEYKIVGEDQTITLMGEKDGSMFIIARYNGEHLGAKSFIIHKDNVGPLANFLEAFLQDIGRSNE